MNLTWFMANRINKAVFVWTPKAKSLLPSLYKREESPSLAKRG
jgi:hypothetical protein